jgi:hypothetical protein
MRVTEEKVLQDSGLLLELKERLKRKRFGFIVAKRLRQGIAALETPDTDKGKMLKAEGVEPLWPLLIEDAITYLKMSDSREWRKKFGRSLAEGRRHSLKAFGVEKLKSYFAQFMEFESVLYGAVRYYHEHTLHVFRVWMLGALLLDDWRQDERYPHIEFFDDLILPILAPEPDKRKRQKRGLIKFDEIQAMWCIIALSHDLGYPLQKVDDINNEARAMLRNYAKVNLQDLNFNVPQQHHFINDFILRFISSRTMIVGDVTEGLLRKMVNDKELADKEKRKFRTHVQSKYYLKYSKSLEDFEHGIFSSILLMRSLTYFLESDFDLDALKPLEYNDARQCSIRREILRAIAGHTCEQIYHIRPDTLSFLLILCDELQSWGRPTIREILGADDSSCPTSALRAYGDLVEFELEFPAINKDTYHRTVQLFQRFHKLLRVAVGSPLRDFRCEFTVRDRGVPGCVFVFKFASKKEEPPEFTFTTSGGAEWSPWDETFEDWQKRSVGGAIRGSCRACPMPAGHS